MKFISASSNCCEQENRGKGLWEGFSTSVREELLLPPEHKSTSVAEKVLLPFLFSLLLFHVPVSVWLCPITPLSLGRDGDMALGAADGHSHRQRHEMPQIQVQWVGNLLSPQFHDLWGLQALISMGFVLQGALLGPSAAAQCRPWSWAVSPCPEVSAALPSVLEQLLLAMDGTMSWLRQER